MKYFDEMQKAMEMLAAEPNTLFLGQATACDGTVMSTTLKNIPLEKRLELPVNEELQMGMSIGLSMGGIIPISIYPRWNFLLLATNQLVNHLDKLTHMRASGGGVIIRVGVGSQIPLHPQHQHIGDYKKAFEHMLETVKILDCKEPEDIYPNYVLALERAKNSLPTIVSEYGDGYSK
jgi:pyruvate/2-oxoglutarate/acetoin dehydrogenase E1 component